MTMTQVCISIRSKNLSELREKIQKASAKCDILEIWLDQLEGAWAPGEILKMTSKPILFVNRAKAEKGVWNGTEDPRIAVLEKCLRAGASMIDVGITTDSKLISKLRKTRGKSSKIIISYHHYTRTQTFKSLWKILLKAKKLGADIVKIVTFAQKAEDNLTIIKLLLEAKKKHIPLIAHAMGKSGKLSRVLASSLDSSITYVALDGRSLTAPGQLTVAEYQTFRSILNSDEYHENRNCGASKCRKIDPI